MRETNSTQLMLTIAVPTYNRNEKLLQQLERLLAQADGTDLELLVVDNCSPEAIEPFLARSLSHNHRFSDIRVIRNPGNIGLGANMLRCIEASHGTWVWLLGDDDPVLPQGLATARAAIKQAGKRTYMIKTGWQRLDGQPEQEARVVGLSEVADLCHDAPFFSNLLHISSSIINREKALAYLNYGYHWNYSCAPHLAMLFAALRDKHELLLYAPAQIKSAGYDQGSWSVWRLRFGMPTLMELDGCDPMMRRWLAAVFASWYRRRWLVGLMATIVRGGTRSPDYWRAYCLRLASVSSLWRSCWLVVVALGFCPLLKVAPLRTLLRRVFGQRIEKSAIDRA